MQTANDGNETICCANGGRAWGIFLLGILFGVGGYFLLRRSFQDWPGAVAAGGFWAYVLYAVLALVGLVKGEIIFRRKVMARTLARARQAIGETGWSGDAPLAPFCMLSLYRPWKVAHAISSFVLIPIMVGLAIFFRNLETFFGLDGSVAALIRGPVYFGIGLALVYGCGVYLTALVRFIGWWSSDGRSETMPLPAAPDRPIGVPQQGNAVPEPVAERR